MQNLTSEQIKLLSNIYDMLTSNDKDAISLGKDLLVNEPLLSNLNILLYYVKSSMESDNWFYSTLCFTLTVREIEILLQKYKYD